MSTPKNERSIYESIRPLAVQLLGELVDLPWAVAVNTIAASDAVPSLARVIIYRAAGLEVALSASVAPGVRIRGRNLKVSRGSTINAGCLFDCREQISVGSNCGIGFDSRFITSSHNLDDESTRAGPGQLAGITIGDGVWIGSGVTILPGVEVGSGAVVAAGAVVANDCEPNILYGGIPAREIKSLPTKD